MLHFPGLILAEPLRLQLILLVVFGLAVMPSGVKDVLSKLRGTPVA